MRKDLAWLRKEVARVVNHNSGQPDQDFDGTSDDPWSDFDRAINEAYEEEYNKLLNETDAGLFRAYDNITWPANQRLLELPDFLRGVEIERIDDATEATPGNIIAVYNRGWDYFPTVHIIKANTLAWETTGPASERTLQIFYMPKPNTLEADSDEPHLVPDRFRTVLVWTAAIIMRCWADDEAPQQWILRRDDIRSDMQLSMAKGTPRSSNRERIEPLQQDDNLL